MKKITRFSAILISIVLIIAACKKVKHNAEPKDQLKELVECVQDPVVSKVNILKKQGQNYVSTGEMSVWNTNDYIYILIETVTTFDNSKLYIGDCNSVPNHFNTNNIDHDPAVSSYTYEFPNTYVAGEDICVSIKISGNRLASLSYKIMQICDCEIHVGDFRTQSKGGWGANPNGGNNAQYMYDNWSAISEISIGCDANVLSFSSPEDITDYLPNGHNSEFPFNTNLATQTVALSISLALDTYIDDFGGSDGSLGCLIVDSQMPDYVKFNGLSVNDLLVLANEVIGGCNTDYSVSEMTAIIDAINLNFHDGTIDNGLLTCGDCD